MKVKFYVYDHLHVDNVSFTILWFISRVIKLMYDKTTYEIDHGVYK